MTKRKTKKKEVAILVWGSAVRIKVAVAGCSLWIFSLSSLTLGKEAFRVSFFWSLPKAVLSQTNSLAWSIGQW